MTTQQKTRCDKMKISIVWFEGASKTKIDEVVCNRSIIVTEASVGGGGRVQRTFAFASSALRLRLLRVESTVPVHSKKLGPDDA